MAGKITLYDAIDSHIRSFESNLYTALPAVVKSYDSNKQMVSVVPALNKLTDQKESLPWPTLNKVPLMFPSAGGGLLSFPVNVGDTVLLVFSKNSIDRWKVGSGLAVDLDSERSHAASDAIAIAGLYTSSSHLNPNPNDVELKFNNNSILLKENGSVEIKSNSTVKIQNNQVELVSLLSQLVDTINSITVNTVYGPSPINNILDFTALKAKLDTLKG